MLRPMEPHAEPKVLYPDSQLDAEDGLAIIRGTTFFVATRRGDLMPPGAPQVGLFCDDTRFLSRLELRVNGQEPIVLSSTTMGADMARVELTVQGGSVSGENLDLPINTIYVHREQLLDRNRLYDILDIENFHHATVVLNVELFFAADFMDIFQVRGLLRGKSGSYFCPKVRESCARLQYEGLDERIRSTRTVLRATTAVSGRATGAMGVAATSPRQRPNYNHDHHGRKHRGGESGASS